jgi:penicillin V acylase-like amidase (Ntn superfamily)
MPQPVQPQEQQETQLQKWTRFVDHNRRRYFHDPSDLNLMIWVKTEEKLEQYLYQ